jgi:hypothetical protein
MCAAEYPLAEAVPPELIPVLVTVDRPAAEEIALAQDAAGEAEEPNEAAAVAVGQSGGAAMAAMAAMHGRQRRPASALKRAVEVISGGLAGCLVAYYGLAAWFGPEFKNFGFPDLPFVAWITKEPVKTDPGGEKAAEKPAAAKPADSTGVPETPDAGKTPAGSTTKPKTGAKPPSGPSARAP